MYFCDSISLFSALEICKDEFYFRGYKDYTIQMTPTLGRCHLQDKELLLIKECYRLVYDKYNFKNVKDLIEFGQHYSLPTRLLDWSLNPYIALFFSIKGKEDTDDICYIGRISRKDPLIKDENALQRYRVMFEDIHGLKFSEIHGKIIRDITKFDPLLDDQIRIINSKIYENVFNKYYLIDSMPEITLFHYHDDFPNMRKEFQRGLFTLHKYCCNPFPKSLYEEIELRLTAEEKKKVLSNLTDMGIYSEAILSDEYCYEKQIKDIVDEVKKT